MERTEWSRRHPVVRGILTGMGSLILLLFSPVLSSCFNEGSFVGMAAGALLLLAGIFICPLGRLLARVWRSRVGRSLLLLLALAALAVLVFAGVTLGRMIGGAAAPPESGATVVVLGCQVKDGQPGLMLSQRLDAAYAYLTDHPDAMAVLSGGQDPDEALPEAEAMYLDLVGRGIAPGRLYQEGRSTSAAENLAYSAQIIEQNGLSREVAVVPHPFHQYRAARFARSSGLTPGAVNAVTGIFAAPTYYLRELLGLLWMQVMGR